MIGSLKGKVADIYDEELIIDVNGVGYSITPSASVRENLKSLGEVASFHIFTDVRENDISLYGFSSRLEREVFLLLKRVKGIGSKVALGIISSIGADDLLVCIGNEDIDTLKALPGIGKKTAERLIVELREQVVELTHSSTKTSSRNKKTFKPQLLSSAESTSAADAVLALEKLGVTSERAVAAVEAACLALGEEVDSGELLKGALANL